MNNLPLRLGLMFLALALMAPRVWFAAGGLPILLGDALFFVPVALQHLLYGDLSNPFMSPIADGGGPYIWHGWLYPLALSWIGSLFSVRGVQGIQVIDSLLVAASALIFALAVARAGCPAWLKVAAVVCACALLPGASGRPEVIAQLFLVAWLAALPSAGAGRQDLLSALVLAGIAVAQPTIAMLGGLFYSTYLAHARPTRDALLSIARVAGTSMALALVLTLWLYPWSLGELAHGVLEQARSLARRNDGNFVVVYLTQPGTPLNLVWLVLAVAAGVLLAARRVATAPKSALFYPLLACGAFLVWSSGMRISYTAYNVTVFFPLLVYGLMQVASDGRLRPFGAPLGAATACMAALLLFAQARGLALLQVSARDGAAPAEVARAVQADLQAGRKVAITANLAMVAYPMTRLPGLIVMPHPDDKKTGDADVMYLHQASTGRRRPGEFAGWHLETDRFMNGVRIAGLPLANTPPGYSFARYVRSGVPPFAKDIPATRP